ncbi:MAG: hypothetical protein M3O26_15700 [Pseudomonadota bacterium]|nr:hypothetical protein [Pseudomonadota bacterium]
MPQNKNFAATLVEEITGEPLMQFDIDARTMRVVAAPDGGIYIDFPALGGDMELGFFRAHLPPDAADKLMRTLGG